MCRSVTWKVLLLLLLASPAVSAHKPSDSYLSLVVEGRSIIGQWDIAVRDLEFAIGVDADDDGKITWGELRRRHLDIASYALSRLTIRSAGSECPTRASEHLVDDHSDGAYEVLKFRAECERAIESLQLDYALFLDIDPQHRGLMQARHGDTVHTAILGAERRVQRIEFADTDPVQQFLDYVREGVRHIWLGFDHILFLLTLLLPAVLRRRLGCWVAVATFRAAAVDVIKIVTAFTLAHSVSLSLAVIGVISLPTRLVESAIAATVVIVALNNVLPIITRRIWLAAFGFGLIHGLGFANALADLGLPDGALVRSLLGFNLGVEIGQLVVVMAFLPLSYWLRSGHLYRQVVMVPGSVAIAVLAAVWFVERAFNLTIAFS